MPRYHIDKITSFLRYLQRLVMAADSDEAVDVSEDLVLKDSPLDQYLKEIGISDFASYSSIKDCESCHEMVDETLMSIGTPEDRIGPSPPTLPFSTDVKKSSSSRVQFKILLEKFMHPTSLQSLKLRNCTEELFDMFSNSEVLRDSVASKKYPAQANADNDKNFKLSNISEQLFLGKHLAAWSLMWLIVCIGIGLFLKFSTSHPIALFAITTIFLAALLFSSATACRLYLLQKVDQCCNMAATSTEVFINHCEAFCKALDKSFLLIRECEVIAQGWTFYHPSMPTLQSGSRRRGSCLTLRKTVMNNCLQLFEIIASTAKLLTKSLPDNLQLIYAEDGIFNITTNEIQSSINQMGYKEDEVPPSDLLKSMMCLIKSEIVEMFQITLLLLEKQLEKQEISIQDSSDSQILIDALTATLTDTNTTLLLILNDINSKYSFAKENEFKEKLSKNKPRLTLPKSPLEMKIDSAALHLKSAIGHLECLENLLSSNIANNECLETPEALTQEIHQLTSVFNYDLESAKYCVGGVDEAFLSKINDIVVDECSCTSKAEASRQVSAPIICHEEPIVEPEGDQLLEGISAPFEEHSNDGNMEQSILEEKRLKRQLNENKRLINELKVIFSFKKSPVGLVPFDLLKQNINIANNIEEITVAAESQQSVSLHPNSGLLSNDILEFEADCTAEDRQDRVSLRNESESATSGARLSSLSVLSDLKSVLMSRQQEGLLNEKMLESDTFGCDSDDASSGGSDPD